MKRIVVLGSTGSIGRQTLDIVRAFPGEFEVVGLAGGNNVDLLREQAAEFRPAHIWSAAGAGGVGHRRAVYADGGNGGAGWGGSGDGGADGERGAGADAECAGGGQDGGAVQ